MRLRWQGLKQRARAERDVALTRAAQNSAARNVALVDEGRTAAGARAAAAAAAAEVDIQEVVAWATGGTAANSGTATVARILRQRAHDSLLSQPRVPLPQEAEIVRDALAAAGLDTGIAAEFARVSAASVRSSNHSNNTLLPLSPGAAELALARERVARKAAKMAVAPPPAPLLTSAELAMTWATPVILGK